MVPNTTNAISFTPDEVLHAMQSALVAMMTNMVSEIAELLPKSLVPEELKPFLRLNEPPFAGTSTVQHADGTKVCQMLSWRTKNEPHSINI